MGDPGTVTEITRGQALIEVGNKRAVLAGINKYQGSISSLKFSANDINGFYEILVDPKKGEYNSNNVKVLSDIHEEKPQRNNIISKLANMARSADPEDSILFYFSGHGYEKNEKSYLLCSDSYSNTLEETAIPTEQIRGIMEGSLARVKILIIDACHSGAIKGVKDSGVMTKSFFETFFPAPEGFVVLTSCKLGEYSYEWNEKEHGVFSYYLLEGMKGAADKDGDRVVTITDAHKYTSENVKRWAFQKGVEQNPTLEAKISGDIPLVLVESVSEKEEPVDKDIISGIMLETPSTEHPKEEIEALCGSLLNFVDANKIEREGTSLQYKFPFGRIWRRSFRVSDAWLDVVDVSFEYKKAHWSKIDKIISHFDEKYYWKSIQYRIAKRLDINKLVQKCKETSFDIIRFTPDKGEETIVVSTEAWLDTNTTFMNKEDHSEIRITHDDRFSALIYSTLSPENIVEFIESCIE